MAKPKKFKPTRPNDRRNSRNAAAASVAVTAYKNTPGADKDEFLCDLVADLAHWCDRNNGDLSDAIRRAKNHYYAETSGKGKQFDGVSVSL